MKEGTFKHYAGLVGIDSNCPGKMGTYGHLIIAIFKYLKVCYGKESLDLIWEC